MNNFVTAWFYVTLQSERNTVRIRSLKTAYDYWTELSLKDYLFSDEDNIQKHVLSDVVVVVQNLLDVGEKRNKLNK